MSGDSAEVTDSAVHGIEDTREGQAHVRDHLIDIYGSLKGVVHGVEFDFTQPDLPTSDWFPSIDLVGSAYGAGKDEPWLIFPWTPAKDRKQVGRSTGATRVFPGDLVRVERAIPLRIGPDIWHPSDRLVYEARLVVERSSGRRTHVPKPLLYYHIDTTRLPGRAGRPTFSVIMARALEAAGYKSLDLFEAAQTIFGSNRRMGVAEAALESASEVQQRFTQLLDAASEKFGDDAGKLRFSLMQLINDAAATGYFAATAEAEIFMARPAQAHHDLSLKRQQGAKTSRAIRMAKAEAKREHAEGLIRDFLARPSLHPPKGEAIAEHVRLAWSRSDVKAPGRSTTLGYLNRMVREGRIKLEN